MLRLHSRHEYRAVHSYGIRIGYWPCVGGPFLQVNAGRYYRSFWLTYSRPSAVRRASS